jgi:anti-sigma B factor antagonist
MPSDTNGEILMTQEHFFDARLIDGDILAVLLRGSLDSATTEEFDREIQKHLDEGRSKIIIDCRYLDNLTSMGIGRLVALQTRLRRKGGAVKLATIDGPAAEVIRLVGLGKILDIYGDLEFARESFYE